MGSIDSPPEFKILIVGGGIAGLATGLSLRSPTRTILILEQSPLAHEIGATISLQPNASKFVSSQWRLGPLLEKKGSMIDRAFRICSVDGKEAKRIDLVSKTEYGGERMLYHRQDLHDVLKFAALDPTWNCNENENENGKEKENRSKPAQLRVSSRVVSCDCENGSVTLASGEVLSGFDLIIGADGIKSNLRKHVLSLDEESYPVPTGQAAYRMMIDASVIDADEEVRAFLDPREAVTTMVMGHRNRLIMGPARKGELFSIVAMVPDSTQGGGLDTSWTTRGDMNALLESFSEYPDWCKRLFNHSPDLGLWQLRDLDPLSTWTRGRLIIIGDAAHAMLPTQGQGASQAIEDAEAIQAFFSDITGKPTKDEILSRLKAIDETRRPRASQIQLLSRESAKPATEQGDTKIKISPDQYMDYCCTYNGAKAWNESLKV